MAKGKIIIDSEVESVLRSAKIDGCLLKIVQQLDRKLYEKTNKILVALGGKWTSGKTQAHIFPRPIAEILNETLDNGFAVDTKKELGQFFTPPEIAARMVELLEVEPGMCVLEPSAGTGNLIKALLDFEPSLQITAVEIDVALAKNLTVRFPQVKVICGNCLDIPIGTLYDRIIMNPPFGRGNK